ncbi:MAG: hypothetical protein H7330_04925 [Hymenobacteraceae bacterium]|nr:hypothetical protein [Hymenobacteraceae bacterium]
MLLSYSNAIRLAKDYRHKRFDRFYGKRIDGLRRNADTVSYQITLLDKEKKFYYNYRSKSPKRQHEVFTEMLDDLKRDTTGRMSPLRHFYPGVSDSLAVRQWLAAADSLVNQFQPIALDYGFYKFISEGRHIRFFSGGGSLLYAESDSASVQSCAELMNWERSHTHGYGGAWSSVWTFTRLNEHFTFYYPSDTLRLDK